MAYKLGSLKKNMRCYSIPAWDLTLVLKALSDAPFEPLESVSLKLLSPKTALLVALASVKHVGDLTARPACSLQWEIPR